MSELHIFDMMAFVHAGNVNKYSFMQQTVRNGAGWETQVIPTGGASLIFNSLYELVGRHDVVVVSDRNPVIKKDMIPGYKENRSKRHDITVNKAATEYILQQCKVPLLARDGYEADDLAYSIVQDTKGKYDHVYLYTGDSDWYFMVDKNTSIRKSSSRAKDVNYENYEDVTGYWYNSITLSKICDGDSSDNIPSLPRDISAAIQKKFVKNSLRGMLGDKEKVLNLFNAFFPNYTYQVDNVFPLYVSGLPTEFGEADRRALCNFGMAIKNKKFAGRQYSNFDVQQHISELCSKGIYLITEGDE